MEISLEESKGSSSSQVAVKHAMLFDTQYQSVNKRKNYEDLVMKTAGKPDSLMLQSSVPDEMIPSV